MPVRSLKGSNKSKNNSGNMGAAVLEESSLESNKSLPLLLWLLLGVTEAPLPERTREALDVDDVDDVEDENEDCDWLARCCGKNSLYSLTLLIIIIIISN